MTESRQLVREVIERLHTLYRRYENPLAEVCFATAGAAWGVAGIGAIFGAESVALGLLWIGIFYAGIGVSAFIEQARDLIAEARDRRTFEPSLGTMVLLCQAERLKRRRSPRGSQYGRN